ncbi:MAG: DUF3800 domain-containing protein [Bifidobacteriaceae bacterium]|nr:DUF3800 domain-containing protein [Bifidobacteriaceae bacterium]
MRICYGDEAGETAVYDPSEPTSTPVFVLAAITVDTARADRLLMDYLALKSAYDPALKGRLLADVIQHEVKGARLRRAIRSEDSPRSARRAIIYLDRALRLLEVSGCRIMGRVLVKRAGEEYSPAATYPSAVAELAETFNDQLTAGGERGLVILDAQTKVKNQGNVHTITTRRYRKGGNAYPGLIESPVFGHSDTHVMLQLADLVASALVYPAAIAAYLEPDQGDPQRSPAYQTVRELFGRRLANLEWRFTDGQTFRGPPDMAKREGTVPRPLRKSEYALRFATRQAEKGWTDLVATAADASGTS